MLLDEQGCFRPARQLAIARNTVGKPFARELDQLAATYAWAFEVPLGDLPRAIRACCALPLVAVGSGGSYTTATFAASLHRRYAAQAASAMTPLDAVSTPQSLRATAVLLATAGGRNPDVLGAFLRLAEREPRRLLAFCARSDSPLSRLVAKHSFVDLAEFEPPTGKDGFLATNSLLASTVILSRAYAAAYLSHCPLPERFDDIFPTNGSRGLADTAMRCEPLWRRSALLVLYGPSCHAAAVDIESKFSEAALGSVQLSDFRNFAHGRHHWLAKRGPETGVLAMVADEDLKLADPLLKLIPRAIPVLRLAASGTGPVASLSAMVQAFAIVGSAGKARGIDPGDPGVMPFGRKIYHLRAFGSRRNSPVAAEAAAIERKSGATVSGLLARGTLAGWRSAYSDFRARLTAARYRGVVLDYDGTLCSEAERFRPLSVPVARQLNRLLRAGVVIGMATGRGQSVKKALREAVPKRFWDRVVVGYYNGGDVAALADDARPDGVARVDPALSSIACALLTAVERPALAKLTFRIPQITIEPGLNVHSEDLWNLVERLIFTAGAPGIAAVRSSHSIDVLAPGVTKLAVIARVRDLLPDHPDASILCIGDRGRWPGNDYALLGSPFALSVDEVSPDPLSGWNLAAPGRRGVTAAVDYLEGLDATASGLRMTGV